MSGRGMAGMARFGKERFGMERFGVAVMDWFGSVGSVLVGNGSRGKEWRGPSRTVVAWCGWERQVGIGMEVLGGSRLVGVRNGRYGLEGTGKARHGQVRHG